MSATLIIKSIIGVLIVFTVLLSWIILQKKRMEIALIVISSVIALGISEFALRIFLPQITEYGKMIIYDPFLGWKFVSNGSGQIVHPGAVVNTIVTNQLGFRDRAPSDKKKKKLMVLGDSFVSNIAVKEGEVFTQIMEDRMKEFDVLNFGVNGYGQVQEYLLMKKWLDIIDPDLIILVIYLQNDLSDNVGNYWLYPRPYASLEGADSILTIHRQSQEQHLKLDKEPDNFISKSHLNRLFTRAISNLFIKQDSLYVAAEFQSCKTPITEDNLLRLRVMEELLIKIAATLKEKNIPIVFALAPSIVQVVDDQWEMFVKENSSPKRHYIRSLPNDQLVRFGERHNLMILDLLPILLREHKKIDLYHPVEQHWTKDGNRTVANAIMDYLTSKKLINHAN